MLTPGSSAGVHRHTNDQEYDDIVSGRGVMTPGGLKYEVSAGDVTAVLPGGSHGLGQGSDERLRVTVISLETGEV